MTDERIGEVVIEACELRWTSPDQMVRRDLESAAERRMRQDMKEALYG